MMMKKIIGLFLSIFVLGSVFAYTPTATDQAMAQAFIKRIEEIRVENPQQFESLKNLFPLLVEKTKLKPKSYYIFSSLYDHFIVAESTMEDESIVQGSVNINTATFEQLKNIIHIDDERAAEIIKLRPFTKIEDLTRVNGIATVRIAEIIEQGIATVK